jgi:hypothetical protein
MLLFKRLLVLFCLLMLCLQAYAVVYLIEPLDQKLLPGQELSFGKISRGETLKVVVKKKSDLGQDWSQIKVDQEFLPPSWKAESVETDKTLIALVTLSEDAAVSMQRLKFLAVNQSQPELNESFFATVSVHESLLSASIEDLSQNAVLGKTAIFSLVLNNDSIAEHSLKVESSLPGYWFQSQEITLAPNETRAVGLSTTPLTYGEKSFSFNVSSLHNATSFDFPAKLNTRPTLLGMYQAPITGLPIFSPTMLPYYLINGILSIFS